MGSKSQDDDIHDRRVAALKMRREHLQLMYSRNGTAYDRARLVSLQRVQFFLATRFLASATPRPGTVDEEAPKHVLDSWELAWYFGHLTASLEALMVLKNAVQSERLTPRYVSTRAPVPSDQLRDWLAFDIRAAAQTKNQEFWNGEPPSHGASANFPDLAITCPANVGVDPDDLIEWLEGQKIATREEWLQYSGSGAVDVPTSQSNGQRLGLNLSPDRVLNKPERQNEANAKENLNGQASPPQPTAPGIRKEQVLIAFEKLVSINLSKALANGRTQWVIDARVQRGVKGGRHQSLWNPVVIAVALKENYGALKNRLNAAFRDHAFLAEWEEEWEEKSRYLDL